MYTLYIANKNYSSWSLRAWALMKQLEIPFVEKLVPFNGHSNTEAFSQFAPNAKVPCLYDGDLVIWDSLAICEFIADNHEAVWPSDAEAKTWARCAVAEMHSGFEALRIQCAMSVGVRSQLHKIDEALASDIARVDELWNEGINKFGGPFLAGDRYTAVDAFYAPVVFRYRTFSLPFSKISADYAQRILALNSMIQWERAAVAEVWRDLDHEKETELYSAIVTDLRAVE